MEMRLILFALLSFASAQALTPAELVLEEWETWKTEHGKNYSQGSRSDGGSPESSNSEEEQYRRKIWMENKAKIERHNRLAHKGLKSFFLGMNQFGDLLTHEVNAKMNGAIPSSEFNDITDVPILGAKYIPPAFQSSSYPESVDWRKLGAVTPVKDQDECGSCWAFSATGALEAMHHRATGVLTSLSEQNLIDCSSSWGNDGCNGGDHDQAFNYIRDNGGIEMERSYPYEAMESECRYKINNKAASDLGSVHLQRGDEHALKTAIASQGPCSVSIDSSLQSFHHYKGGIYREEECSNKTHNHAVLVVGYGVDENSGSAYWLVKNSWAETWGEKGYMRLARNENNMCCIACHASYPLV